MIENQLFSRIRFQLNGRRLVKLVPTELRGVDAVVDPRTLADRGCKTLKMIFIKLFGWILPSIILIPDFISFRVEGWRGIDLDDLIFRNFWMLYYRLVDESVFVVGNIGFPIDFVSVCPGSRLTNNVVLLLFAWQVQLSRDRSHKQPNKILYFRYPCYIFHINIKYFSKSFISEIYPFMIMHSDSCDIIKIMDWKLS